MGASREHQAATDAGDRRGLASGRRGDRAGSRQSGSALANGDKVPYDRLLIATGVRSRQWFNPEEAKLKGLFTLRTSDDAAELQAALKARPKRVLIVGAGFIGSEMASVCRDLGLDVTVASEPAHRWSVRSAV